MNQNKKSPEYRIGHGFDVHKFGDGDHLVLGGVAIPYHRGFVAHSDGDVLIHALCDAILGSIAAGDIGQHFPDTDDRYKNIESIQLLKQVHALLKAKSYDVSNVDITIIAQEPKMFPFINDMRNRLSGILDIETEMINIKATTTEGLGYCGRKEGIAVHSAVMVQKLDNC
jgi:2-C-methyl-D-erythritol 2,4-cyclodiphosphate synthase